MSLATESRKTDLAKPMLEVIDKGGPDKDSPAKLEFSAKQLVLGALFGILFGFLLQRGGVAKYNVLLGVLLLEDFTVVKVMLTAIVVGTVGIFTMYFMGLVKLHIQPTRYAANIIGGLLFGVGFALLGYCPGTGAAAIGQGNFDALIGVVGLLAGSYLFAEMSDWLGKTVMKWGDRGKLMVHEVVAMPLVIFLLIWVPILLIVLFVLNALTTR